MPAPPPESEPAMVTAIAVISSSAWPAPHRRRAEFRPPPHVGSFASDSAEITETPSAPASITGAALAALMPAMPQVRKPGFRRCSASMTFAMPAMPIGEFLVTFEVVP